MASKKCDKASGIFKMHDWQSAPNDWETCRNGCGERQRAKAIPQGVAVARAPSQKPRENVPQKPTAAEVKRKLEAEKKATREAAKAEAKRIKQANKEWDKKHKQ